MSQFANRARSNLVLHMRYLQRGKAADEISDETTHTRARTHRVRETARPEYARFPPYVKSSPTPRVSTLLTPLAYHAWLLT